MVAIRVRILQEGLWQLIHSTGRMENRTRMVQKKWKEVSSGSNVVEWQLSHCKIKNWWQGRKGTERTNKALLLDSTRLAQTMSSQKTIFHCDYTLFFFPSLPTELFQWQRECIFSHLLCLGAQHLGDNTEFLTVPL